ncbi:PH domain-containing protein [Candidatus Sumerlaeota bacterium]|nr:PH domain-containing protein [Candidatus Sumerlaeota bacterium]
MKQSSNKYIFRRPWWRMLAPILFVAVVWTVPYAWQQVQANNYVSPQLIVYLAAIEKWFQAKGLSTQFMSWIPIVLTILLLIWFVKGLQSLVLTEDGLYRSYFFWRTRSLPWDDVKEIRIDRTITRLEDHRSTTRRLVLKFMPEIRWLWSPKIVIDNATYPEYPFAEAIAVRTGVSHMARRMYRQTMETGKPVTFAPIGFSAGFGGTIIYWAIAFALVYAAQQGQWWTNPLLTHFPILLYTSAVVLFFWGIDIFFYRQLGCDGKNLLIMRRSFVTQTIPIAAIDIDSIDIHNNALKIYARMRKGKQLTCVYSTKRFIRNRGAMLCMIRSIYEFLRRRHLEAMKTDTQRIKTVRLEDYAPRFKGEDENGDTDSASAETPKALPAPATEDKPQNEQDDEFDSSMPDEVVYVPQTPEKNPDVYTNGNGLFTETTPETDPLTPVSESDNDDAAEDDAPGQEEIAQEEPKQAPMPQKPATLQKLPDDYEPPTMLEEELPGLEIDKESQTPKTNDGDSKLWQ